MNKELCWECTGDGWMIGNRPCKVCRGTGYIETENETTTDMATTKIKPDEIQMFDRSNLKVNAATQDAIIKRFNTQPELYESLELLYSALVNSGHIDNINGELVQKVERAIENAQKP